MFNQILCNFSKSTASDESSAAPAAPGVLYLEQDSEIRRAVGVIKMRDSNHEKGMRQFVVAAHGVEIQGRLDSLTGLLGWSALREQQAPQ